ncbi:MAG: T9SS type A sorting domain-containing protein [candidate division Zixibacteria bacterium]|nr:T9SS type A sorting domain-containing protein [candidate division Zixibacteria bacterium]
MKKTLSILLLFVCFAGNVFASDALIVNQNPVGGDLLESDTCNILTEFFGQLPTDCDGQWALVTSDTDYNYFVYDDFEQYWEIKFIHFWGSTLKFDGSWTPCEEDPMTFNIYFCQDNGSGAPNDTLPTDTYTITIAHDPDTVCFLNGEYPVREWYTELDPPCYLHSYGWVGIQGVGNNDSCVFLWYNSEWAFGYDSYQTGTGHTGYNQAFCMGTDYWGICLICDAVTHTPRVPRVDGIMQWDLTVTNCGGVSYTPLFGEIVPTNLDCNGPQYDFNLTRIITDSLMGGGNTYTGHYYYRPGEVATNFTDVALWTFVGDAPNTYISGCCFEFAFSSEWGRGVGNSNYWGEKGEWGERENIVIPQSTILGQNYPNPFNAETVIPFEMKNPGDVNLSIYNLTGQVVEILIDGSFTAGQHSVTWNASKYSSGVYFYKLRTDNYVTTKKMEVVK